MARRRRRRKGRRRRGKKFRLPRNTGIFLLAAALLFAGFLYARHFLKLRSPYLKAPRRPAPAAPALEPAPSRKYPPGRGAKIVFVIDDMGHTADHLPELRRLGNQVTYAILPFLKHSHFFNEYSNRTRAEVILHLPMESVSGTIPGPGLITSAMDDDDVRRLVRRELDSLSAVRGANNHMGSRGTADPRLMRIVLEELKRRGLLFLDSMTTLKTVSRDVAADMNFGPVLKRDVFLDNTDEQGKIRKQIRLLASVAKLRGQAIGIGHYRYNTLHVLAEEIPKLRKEGYRITSLGELRRLQK